ncbi:hypothetical protein ACIRS1_35000 [Kitasatospora sp. NPDC101176]|uniref:hypothetical protein n=1 Tax=Kitasatospora sp. NPDC101176 TaxID=3364099 RepID=UPI003830E343
MFGPQTVRELQGEDWKVESEDLAEVSPYLTGRITRFGGCPAHELYLAPAPEAYEPHLDVDFTKLSPENEAAQPRSSTVWRLGGRSAAELGNRKRYLLALRQQPAVEAVQDEGGPGIPLDDRRDLWRDTVGPSTCDPLLQEHVRLRSDPKPVDEVVAQQTACGVVAVAREMVRKELRLGR